MPAPQSVLDVFRHCDAIGKGTIPRDTLEEALMEVFRRQLRDSMGDADEVNYTDFLQKMFAPHQAVTSQLSRVTSADDLVTASGQHLGAARRRPPHAHGTFLRVITINDVYTLENYPRVASAVAAARAASSALDCVVMSCINGDFLSPCTLTALDGGTGMAEALNAANIDFACLGNHEFDIGFDMLKETMKAFKGKVINTNLDVKQLDHLPKHHIINVGSRNILVTGCCTGDESIYTKPYVPSARDSAEACLDAWEKAKQELGTTPDILLPMTHHFLSEDKAFVNALSKNAEIEPRMPCVLGGHEHEVIIEEIGSSMIVKVGQDAKLIGSIDIWWTREGKMECSCMLLPANTYDEEDFVHCMMQSRICPIPSPMSSKSVRFGPSGVATFLLDLTKNSFNKYGIELVLINAGNIRGRRDYEPGDFKMGDLYTELPWNNEMAFVQLPGKVIADSIRWSRQGDGPKPGFLHTDSGANIDDAHELREVNGQPLDPEKQYNVALLVYLLTGMDFVMPLLKHVAETQLQVPDVESCKFQKHAVIKSCIRNEWRTLVGNGECPLSQTMDGEENQLSYKKTVEKVMKLVSEMDYNKDGFIDKQECAQYFHSKGYTGGILGNLVDFIDANADGKLSAEELVRYMQ